MSEPGYKSLISYKLSQIAFDLGWEFVPRYYTKYEDHRQRDQIKQALRSLKQNIVEGSSERSLSTKLKLYDVAKASPSTSLSLPSISLWVTKKEKEGREGSTNSLWISARPANPRRGTQTHHRRRLLRKPA